MCRAPMRARVRTGPLSRFPSVSELVRTLRGSPGHHQQTRTIGRSFGIRGRKMFARSNSETECKNCESTNARFRDKAIITIDRVDQAGDTMRFYVEGGDGVYTLTWGNLSHHCSSGLSLPIASQTEINTFLRESFMSSASPAISYLFDQKHPMSLPEAELETAKVEVRRVDLHFFYAGPVGQ